MELLMDSAGEVIEVRGVRIVIRVFDESSKETLFYLGEKYKGISIREHVIIRRGFRNIVCIVEGEYLDEKKLNEEKTDYIRKVELKPIGYFQDGEFLEGIKYLPMIRDSVFLISEAEISKIYGKSNEDFIVGKLLKEGMPVSLSWSRLFNTHIGIFGNTGSGKSNTLTNLYTTLFAKKKTSIAEKSQFIILDFNGEYTGNQLLPREEKNVYLLDTKTDQGHQFPLSEDEFWDAEVFGILFKATENTQKPFLSRVIKGRERYLDAPNSLETYTKRVFERALTSASPKKEFAQILRSVAKQIGMQQLETQLSRLSWHGKNEIFYLPEGHLNGGDLDPTYNNFFKNDIDNIVLPDLTHFDQLLVRINLQLTSDLIGGYVQFDHIQPLLKRIESSISSLRKVITVSNPQDEKMLTVISMRKANQEIKKVIPLLLAKYYYNKHKNAVSDQSPPNKTMHLIIDEAHNILSMQSNREHESWKDYRLELFEEIIKEGRKFGMYLTLSSQRPADISPTIMSQLHNFFIHRLVNDRDLFLLENTVSTLDSLSRGMIPNLSKGCCIVTGTSFDLPMVIQFRKLNVEHQPDSDDVDLTELWKEN
jgi:DNA helicase HerA-like ATPase